MLKVFSMSGLALVVFLSGCQAAPGVAPAAVTFQIKQAENPTQSKPLRVLSENQMRSLLNTGAGARLWGETYHLTDTITYPCMSKGVDKYQGSAELSGEGVQTKADEHRFVFQVPEDRSLIINSTEGVGTILINGYDIGTSANPNAYQKRIYYLFGPGELVVMNFFPQAAGNTKLLSRPWWCSEIVRQDYAVMRLSGFTASADYFGGAAGGTLPGEAK